MASTEKLKVTAKVIKKATEVIQTKTTFLAHSCCSSPISPDFLRQMYVIFVWSGLLAMVIEGNDI